MASRFWLACAACLSYDVCGLRYDKHHNRGIGPVLFASICIMSAGFGTTGLPEHDAGYTIIAFSLVVWPGLLWGMVLYPLMSGAEDKAACLWLMISPLFVVLLGLPVLDKYIPGRSPLRDWRIATGLSSIGILTGHFLSQSSLGRTIDEHLASLLSPLAAFSTFKAMTSAAMMFFSVARMVQSHSEAAKDLKLAKRIPTDSLVPGNLPPFWGVQGSLYVITWTAGLALCVSIIDDPQARATLVSMSVAIVLTMAFMPPFLGKIWGRSYDDYVRALFILHIVTVLVHCLCRSLFASSDSAMGLKNHELEDTSRIRTTPQ